MKLRQLSASPRGTLVQAAIGIAAIALLDWRIDLNISFGFLYLFPILLIGTVLSRWQIIGAAVLCTLLSDLFDPFHFSLGVGLPQDILVFTSLAGYGPVRLRSDAKPAPGAGGGRGPSGSREAARVSHREQPRRHPDHPRRTAPWCAPTRRPTGCSESIRRCCPGGISGATFRRLAHVPFTGEPHQAFRTEMQCRGERENGDVFLANVFFSTYMTASGPRLAALIVDASEELREREEAGLEQLMSGSRILVAAVSHEVRNVCGAIAVIHENLVRRGGLAGNQDFEALGALVETLSRIASLELKQSSGEPPADAADLAEILDDLRIVLEPYCKDSDIVLRWKIAPRLPLVWADRHRLLQVLLNLAKNSERALRESEVKTIDIEVSAGPNAVSIRFMDSGPGVESPGKLFQPFQKGAESTGLGLYLSRALLRSFRGDLHHDAAAPGCAFVIDLAIAGGSRENQDAADTSVIAR